MKHQKKTAGRYEDTVYEDQPNGRAIREAQIHVWRVHPGNPDSSDGDIRLVMVLRVVRVFFD
jgi:hypothetical protein